MGLKGTKDPSIVFFVFWDNHCENVKVFVAVVQCRFNLGGIRKQTFGNGTSMLGHYMACLATPARNRVYKQGFYYISKQFVVILYKFVNLIRIKGRLSTFFFDLS